MSKETAYLIVLIDRGTLQVVGATIASSPYVATKGDVFTAIVSQVEMDLYCNSRRVLLLGAKQHYPTLYRLFLEGR